MGIIFIFLNTDDEDPIIYIVNLFDGRHGEQRPSDGKPTFLDDFSGRLLRRTRISLNSLSRFHSSIQPAFLNLIVLNFTEEGSPPSGNT